MKYIHIADIIYLFNKLAERIIHHFIYTSWNWHGFFSWLPRAYTGRKALLWEVHNLSIYLTLQRSEVDIHGASRLPLCSSLLKSSSMVSKRRRNIIVSVVTSSDSYEISLWLQLLDQKRTLSRVKTVDQVIGGLISASAASVVA